MTAKVPFDITLGLRANRPMNTTKSSPRIAIVGGGPAGLMAAEVLTSHGLAVDLYDAMPSLGRKFLMAGKSGLNLTHGEAFETFLTRFGGAQNFLRPILEAFGPDAVQTWARDLGVDTFVGTSGRVFPHDFKAAPLLRAWLRRLRANGLRIHARHRWTGWDADRALTFATPKGPVAITPAATVLALGGASWPKLGSDAAWVPWLQEHGVYVAPLKPANCGFDVEWSEHFIERFEGQPLKGVTLSFDGHTAHGECVVTHTGLEGGPVYTLSGALRDAIDQHGPATLTIDLASDLSVMDLTKRLAKPRGKKSMATHLKRTLGLEGVKAGLLREGADPTAFASPPKLAAAIKVLPIALIRPRPINEAISTAGGIALSQLDANLQLQALPGVFVAGEMLDWDAPTGGYLLTACMATGHWAGKAVVKSMSGQSDLK
jgi:hypothetical protein